MSETLPPGRAARDPGLEAFARDAQELLPLGVDPADRRACAPRRRSSPRRSRRSRFRRCRLPSSARAPRDAVDHLVVDRRAERLRVPPVSEEGRLGAPAPDLLLRDPVELLRRDAGRRRPARRSSSVSSTTREASSSLRSSSVPRTVITRAPCDAQSRASAWSISVGDLGDLAHSVHLAEQPPVPEELHQGLGLLVVDEQALEDRLRTVVRPVLRPSGRGASPPGRPPGRRG